jgi:murein L,D-transpeptidase YcbB/YkuD
MEGDLSPKRSDEERANPDSQKHGIWSASPLALAAASAVFGLLGTAMGAAISGYWNTRLEQQKFEFTLIQRALDADNQNDKAQNLSFLVEIGLIQRLNRASIERLAKSPEKIPQTESFSIQSDRVGVHLTSGIISVADAKRVLTTKGFYSGQIDDHIGPDYQAAILKFQKANGINADGVVGAMTARKLKSILDESGKP